MGCRRAVSVASKSAKSWLEMALCDSVEWRTIGVKILFSTVRKKERDRKGCGLLVA